MVKILNEVAKPSTPKFLYCVREGRPQGTSALELIVF